MATTTDDSNSNSNYDDNQRREIYKPNDYAMITMMITGQDNDQYDAPAAACHCSYASLPGSLFSFLDILLNVLFAVAMDGQARETKTMMTTTSRH